jgi:hypothetical protein
VLLQTLLGLQKYFRVLLVPGVPPVWHTRLAFWTLFALSISCVSGLFHVFDKPDPLENEAVTAYVGTFLIAATTCAIWIALADKYHVDAGLVYAPAPMSELGTM